MNAPTQFLSVACEIWPYRKLGIPAQMEESSVARKLFENKEPLPTWRNLASIGF